MELPNDNTSVEMTYCKRPRSRPDTDQVSNYLWFRIRKNLDIEPETQTTMDKGIILGQNHVRQCVCGCEYEDEEEDDDDEEYLSAYEFENWQDSSDSGNSSAASSFAFPVLDARWSGSPVQMPKRKPEDKKLGFLRKPKLVARIVCRWCRSF